MPEARYCSHCGTALDPSLGGACPRCLLANASKSASAGGGRAPPPAQAELAPHFPAYEISALLGQGGMGSVHRARHRALGRDVAIKVLAPEIASRPGLPERFERETRTLASLEHENVVRVFDGGRAGPFLFLAMELVDGVDLRQMIRAGRVEPRQALAIVVQVCDALQYAHDRGVVHRDIKPENVLVDRRGRAKVLDFGLAKLFGSPADDARLTAADQIVGTPMYMAPEQWKTPDVVDHRADIYSLGVVFYELLTGELPIGRFPPPSRRCALDVRLDEVVLRTLEREPERRYQQASAVKVDVQKIEVPPISETSPHTKSQESADPTIRSARFERAQARIDPRPRPGFLIRISGGDRTLHNFLLIVIILHVVLMIGGLIWMSIVFRTSGP